MFGRGKPMFGGPAEVTEPVWPQPSPYVTDLAKAKQLLVEAGLPNGFETTLSFDMGAAVINEPICELVQESLGQIGIKIALNKIPGANWRAEFAKKHCLSAPTSLADGSTIPNISSSGITTARTRSSIRCHIRTRQWTS